MEAEYVEAFFDSGALRLSSFRLFAKHADEARQDTMESQAHVMIQDEAHHVGAFMITGERSYILSTTLTPNANVVKAFVGADAAIQINDPAGFALEVSRQLAGFLNGFSGHCIYNGRILQRKVVDDTLSAFVHTTEPSLDDAMYAARQGAQGEHYLLKDAAYEYQAEYRFIWNLDAPTRDAIIVQCPQARQFCRKVTREELFST